MTSERGFSLIEVLIATVVFVTGSVALAGLLVVSVNKHQLGRNTVDATLLASTKIEELAKLNFGTAAAVQITPNGADSLGQNVAPYFDTPANGYTRRWQVAAGPNADTRVVTLRVIPPGADVRQFRLVEVTTILRSW